MTVQERKPRDSGPRIILFACLGMVILIIAAIVMLVLAVRRTLRQSGGTEGIFARLEGQNLGAPSCSVSGKPYTWRVLQPGGLRGLSGVMACGDFDGNGDEELLLYGQGLQEVPGMPALLKAFAPDTTRPGYVISTDGNQKECGIEEYFFNNRAFALDYDGDGSEETLPQTGASDFYDWAAVKPAALGKLSNPSLYAPVFTASGQTKTYLYGLPLATGDFDGDGKEDILASDESGGYTSLKVLYYSQGGKKIGSQPLAYGSREWISADVDGDGRDEGLRIDPDAGELWLLRLGQDQKLVGKLAADSFSLCAADLDGDALPEAISTSAFYNFATKKSVAFSFPSSTGFDRFPECSAGDYDGDGKDEVVIATGPVTDLKDLCVFDRSGTCTHHERIDAGVQELYKLRSGGRDYLVARLWDRGLIITP